MKIAVLNLHLARAAQDQAFFRAVREAAVFQNALTAIADLEVNQRAAREGAGVEVAFGPVFQDDADTRFFGDVLVEVQANFFAVCQNAAAIRRSQDTFLKESALRSFPASRTSSGFSPSPRSVRFFSIVSGSLIS